MLQADRDLFTLSWHDFDMAVTTSGYVVEVINLAAEASVLGELESSGMDGVLVPPVGGHVDAVQKNNRVILHVCSSISSETSRRRAPIRLDVNPLDLVERDLLTETIVELGGAGGLVPGDPGRDLEVATVSKVLGDPGAAEAVGADLGW